MFDLMLLCHKTSRGLQLTFIVRFDDLKLVGDCLWKSIKALEVKLSACPFTCTSKSSDGNLSTRTKMLALLCGTKTPLITSDPDDPTRVTSVTVAVSLPVKDINRLPLPPFKKKSIHYV